MIRAAAIGSDRVVEYLTTSAGSGVISPSALPQTMPPHLNTSPRLLLSAGVFPDRRRAPLLLPRRVRLDVSGGRAALPHAGGGLRERVLAQEVLLPVWLPPPGCRGGHLRRRGLQELRHTASVSAAPCCCSLAGFKLDSSVLLSSPVRMESLRELVCANDCKEKSTYGRRHIYTLSEPKPQH